MRGKKKLILTVFIILFVFVFNMNGVRGWTAATTSVSGDLTQNGDNYTLSCGNVTAYFKVIEVLNNNEQKGDCLDENGNQMAGVFWDQNDSKRIKKLTNESAKDGNYHYIVWAHSVTNGTTNSIDLSIENNTTKQKCSGKIQVVPTTAGDYREKNSSVKFDLKIESKSEIKENFSTKVSFDVVTYAKTCERKGWNYCHLADQGKSLGSYSLIHDGTTEIIAKAATECAAGNEQSCETFETEKQESQQVEGTYVKANGKQIASTTGSASIGAGEGQELKCDESLSSFVKEIWKYFIIFAPILLIVMVTMDFFKALFSSDADLLKKASSNAIKRVVATVILLFLPLVISTILDFFGLELCLWGGK